MELEKFARQLRLMVLLTQNRMLTIEEVCSRVGMSRRSVYRYMDAFKEMGFIVRKEGTRYRLDHSSPFFGELVTQKLCGFSRVAVNGSICYHNTVCLGSV